ncbi:hypothetical protein H4R19_000267 [Coemansia spiralis]|nr:hypothetical protein H4R19_000267 [Coemansia spiralis]
MQHPPRAPGPATGLAGEHITVLRVKRKRDQEPLEALLLHHQQQPTLGLQRRQRRKLPRGLSTQPSCDSMAAEWTAAAAVAAAAKDPLLFAFGESVTESDFGDAGKRRALQDRLASLSTRRCDDMDIEDTGGAAAGPALPLPRQPAAANAPQATFRVVGSREVQLGDESARSTPEPPRPRNLIPEVVAAAQLSQGKRRVKMFDAVHEDVFDTVLVSNREQDPYAHIALGPASDSKVAAANPQTADELVPMVRDYLSFAARVPEYVYDFYYIPHAQSAMDLRALRAANIGAVHWIDDVDDYLADSDCDEHDDDEDSNAEDFYRNDYPDEPDSASDMDEYYYSDDDNPAAATASRRYPAEFAEDDDDGDIF